MKRRALRRTLLPLLLLGCGFSVALPSVFQTSRLSASDLSALRFDFDSADGWSLSSGASAVSTGTNSIALDSSVHHKGSTSLKVTRSTLAVTSTLAQSENASIAAGLYDVSYWVKSVSCTPGMTIQMNVVSSGGAKLSGVASTLNASSSLDGWNKVSARLNLPSAYESFHLEFVFNAGSGTIYLDDIEFTAVNEDLLSVLTHFEADSDGNHNGIDTIDSRYVKQIRELEQYDSYEVEAENSGNASVVFYDAMGRDLKQSLTFSASSPILFQAPACAYAEITFANVPTSYSLRRIGKEDAVDPLRYNTNGGFSVAQNAVFRHGEAYYVSKDNCQNWQYKNFFYTQLTSNGMRLLPSRQYTFTYYVRAENASSDLNFRNLLLTRPTYNSSTGEVTLRNFADTIDGVAKNYVDSSFADGAWHKVVKTFVPEQEIAFQYYWQVGAGSADLYVDDFSISYLELGKTVPNTRVPASETAGSSYTYQAPELETVSYISNSVLYVNNVPTSPILYLEPTENDYHKGEANQKVASAHFDLYSTYYGRLDRMWNEDGTISYEDFDRSVYSFLNNGPSARVMVHFAMLAPSWWLSANPDEVAKVYTSSSASSLASGVSFSSAKFIEDATPILQAIIAHMKGMSYWNAVFAFKVSAGRTFEWMEFGMGTDQGLSLGDYSVAAISGFRAAMESKYGTVSSLNSKWGTSYSSFSEIEPPSYADRTGYSSSIYTSALYSDWNLYFSSASASMFSSFAKVIKEATASKKVVGGYYGYLFLYGSYNGIGSIHTALDELLHSPYVDFIASPLAYGERFLGQGSVPMSVNDTVRAHGKLYFLEQDNRTAAMSTYGKDQGVNNASALGYCFDNQSSYDALKADFASDFVNGSGLWYYDMTGNWFDDDSMYSLFSLEKQEMDRAATMKSSDYVNEVAVFVSDDNPAYLASRSDKGASSYLRALSLDQRRALNALGTGYDVYALSSLKEGIVPAHKVNIILGALVMDSDTVSAVNTHLKKDNQYVVYAGPCGYGNGSSFSVSNISSATGFTIRSYSTSIGQVTISNSSIGSITYGEADNAFGLTTYVGGTGKTSWGVLKGKTSTYCGLAYKDASTYKMVYSSVGALPAQLLRYICTSAGVHLYSDDLSDVVCSNSNYVSLHSSVGGQKTITLPGLYDVYDVFAGRYVGRRVETVSLALRKNDTKLYRLEAASTSDQAAMHAFVDEYLHLDDYQDELGYCADAEHGYYQAAKDALSSLPASQRALLATNTAFASAYQRLRAWAYANGEKLTIDGNGNMSVVMMAAAALPFSSEQRIVSIVALSAAGLVSSTLLLLLRRRKRA